MTCVEGGRGKGEAVVRSQHTAAKARRLLAEDGEPSAIVPNSQADGVAAAGRWGKRARSPCVFPTTASR